MMRRRPKGSQRGGQFAPDTAGKKPPSTRTAGRDAVALNLNPAAPEALRWPTRSEWESASRETSLPNDLLPIARKTYNATFLREWQKRLRMSSEADGSLDQWHSEAEAKARAAIRGAVAVPAAEVSRGMVVRTTHPRGFKEQRVASVVAADQGRYAVARPGMGWEYGRDVDENHPEAQFIRSRVLMLANNHTFDFSDDRNLVVRFPGLETQ